MFLVHMTCKILVFETITPTKDVTSEITECPVKVRPLSNVVSFAIATETDCPHVMKLSLSEVKSVLVKQQFRFCLYCIVLYEKTKPYVFCCSSCDVGAASVNLGDRLNDFNCYVFFRGCGIVMYINKSCFAPNSQCPLIKLGAKLSNDVIALHIASFTNEGWEGHVPHAT